MVGIRFADRDTPRYRTGIARVSVDPETASVCRDCMVLAMRFACACRHGDLVDALRLEPLLVDDESRQVVFVAGRGERARQAEQHDGLAGEIILRFDLSPVRLKG